MFYSDDPVKDFERHDLKQSRWLKSRPKCSHCKQPIQDEKLLCIESELFHAECAIKVFQEDTDNYME